MTETEMEYYIKCHNLDIRTAEQVASFMMDNEWCRDSDDKKKEIIRHVHKDKFAEVWTEAYRILQGGAVRR
jgi:hypothetical protein